MAYIALYRKWRPKGFEDVVGQRHITETLQKAIDTDKVAHAYLFSGPRGTGKTSTAKIFARAMNCVHGPTSHPCNHCEVCLHILNGESMDVVEIDAASNRSIEDIRTLRETIKFMPAEGHKKIYIIDEVHMLTTEAFNALLKTLEEPPQHVIFILATTEPERIPMTILSRCQRYEFRRITSADIAGRLLYIAGQEHISLTKGAAHILAVQADGGMRDALSMLDQCVSNGDGSVDEPLVRNVLGLIGKDWLFSLSGAVFSGAGNVIIKAVDDVIRMGKEPQVIITAVLEHLRAVMLYQADPRTDTLAAYADSMDELAAQAREVTAEQVFAVLQVLQQAALSAKTSPAPRIAVEMGLLMASRTRAMPASSGQLEHTGSVPEDVLRRLTRLEQLVGRGKSVPPRYGGKTPAEEAVPLPDEAVYSPDMPEEAVPFPDSEYSLPVSEETVLPPAASVPPEAPARQEAAPPLPPPVPAAPSVSAAGGSGKPVPPATYQKVWQKMCDILVRDMKKPGVRSCVRTGRVVYMGDGEAIVAYKTDFLVKRANREDYFHFVDAALEQVLGSPFHMKGYLEGAAELDVYEKKNNSSAVITMPDGSSTASAPPITQENAEELEPGSDAVSVIEAPEIPESPDTGEESDRPWTPVALEDMPPEERAALEPLLKMVGDCNIYREDKK